MVNKIIFPLQDKTWLANQQAKLHCVHHVFIVEISSVEPLSLGNALAHDHWVEAMKSNLEFVNNKNTWNLCDLPQGRKALTTKWIYNVNNNVEGSLDHLKGILLAKCCSPKEGIEFLKSFSPLQGLPHSKL